MQPKRLLTILAIFTIATAMFIGPAMADSTQTSKQDKQPDQRMQSDQSKQQQKMMQTGQQQKMMQSEKSDRQQQMQSKQTDRNSDQQQFAKTDAPIHISAAALSRIQDQLRQQGFHAGPSDGIWGNSTASAIKAFQKSKNLAPTGNLNIETIQAMDVQGILSVESSENSMGKATDKKAVHPGAQVYISPAQLRNIQQQLSDQGFEVGKTDGSWSKQTSQAVSRYQQDKGMQANGQITIDMLQAMGNSQVLAALGINNGAASQQMARQQSEPQSTEARGYYGDKKQDQQQQPPSAQQQIRGNGAPLYAGSGIIRQVQQALKSAGNDPGRADGKWSKETEKALGRYQQTHNLSPTGTLTVATLQRLMGVGMGMESGKNRGDQSSQPDNMKQTEMNQTGDQQMQQEKQGQSKSDTAQ